MSCLLSGAFKALTPTDLGFNAGGRANPARPQRPGGQRLRTASGSTMRASRWFWEEKRTLTVIMAFLSCFGRGSAICNGTMSSYSTIDL